jgi:hypothetical protein
MALMQMDTVRHRRATSAHTQQQATVMVISDMWILVEAGMVVRAETANKARA